LFGGLIARIPSSDFSSACVLIVRLLPLPTHSADTFAMYLRLLAVVILLLAVAKMAWAFTPRDLLNQIAARRLYN
jgi:hypothetical protein